METQTQQQEQKEKTTDTAQQAMLRALLAAKKEFLSVKRNATNPYLNNSYATLSSVLESVEPALEKHGFIVEHVLDYRDSRTFMITSIIHIDTLCAQTTEIELSYKNGDMQSLGSAITYARRYSLLMLLSLAMEDDDGNNAKHSGNNMQQRRNPFKST